MRKVVRWVGYALAGLLGLGIVGAATLYAVSEHTIHQTLSAQPEPLLMASADAGRGWHIIRTRGCGGCHGGDLRGANMIDQPSVATLYAPNLTLLAATASDQQLAQALRQGIGHDGRPLYIMPSGEAAALTDQELSDVIAALRSAPRGGSATPALALGPLGRIGVATGKLPSAPTEIVDYRAHPAADLGVATAAGRHLAMTTCSGCHGSALTGREVEPGIQSPDLTIVGAYDGQQFARLMKTGRPPNGRNLKLMSETSRKAFSNFSDVEVQQLFAYLQARAQR
ncbi:MULTISPECIES: c-type cytochrome [Sphingomonas]|uniref:c-type cytochrome n=1 Tax=Sphingomonas TaxID=13687 RepID=UPI000DEFE4AB|nr:MULTISPECIES: c-type cytochrome [Sphingomonas]